jgi:starch-binding outer membrane protein, SusD/RagB family
MTNHHATARVAALVLASVVAASCKDADVPFLTAPTSIANTPVGVTNAMTGLFSATRLDVGNYIILMSGFGRDGADFTNTEPRLVTYNTGLYPITNTWIPVWDDEYTDILQAHTILGILPNVTPAYTTAQLQAIEGVARTYEALNYMTVAEVHDTNGAAIQLNGTGLPPAYCNKDVWQYIVALLDSANAELDSAGGTAAPITFPSGMGAISALSGPSTTAGSYAAFNRALAGKAGLELAYAIARSPGGAAPTPTTPGSPDATALMRADSALTHSALYNPGVLGPNPTAGWLVDGFSVLHDFSSASGDAVNPMNALSATFVILNELSTSQDTINDLRWKAKFAVNQHAIQQQPYAAIASPYVYSMYPSPGSYIPIVRNEELVLVEAEIQIGLGNYSAAAVLINDVRTMVGGLPAASIANDYIDTRNALMHEQQISTAIEASGDRTIAIRMYNLAAVVDTSWGANDQHTTIDPIPFTEVSGRGGSWTTTCP